MRTILSGLLGLSLLAVSPALACEYGKADGSDCVEDGSECVVYCEDGQVAGTMFWNGTVWTDGVKWDEDPGIEAQSICDANGSACQ